MANFPMSFPVTWDLDNTLFLKYNESHLAIYGGGEIRIEGNIKDAAASLSKFVFEKEYILGLNSLNLNKAILIDFGEQVTISFIGHNRPDWWGEFSKEFENLSSRRIKMKAFW